MSFITNTTMAMTAPGVSGAIMADLRASSPTPGAAEHYVGNMESFRLLYDAEVFATSSWLFETLQMPLTLPPVPRNNAAEARATNAISSVYSIKSCPDSSVRNEEKKELHD
jgi:hypothetical protein